MYYVLKFCLMNGNRLDRASSVCVRGSALAVANLRMLPFFCVGTKRFPQRPNTILLADLDKGRPAASVYIWALMLTLGVSPSLRAAVFFDT